MYNLIFKISILLILFSYSMIYADSIPGFLDMDINYTRYHRKYNKSALRIAETKLNITYGATFNWFKPYIFAGWETFFRYGAIKNLTSNKPYQDIYNYGIGFFIKKIFYFEYEHKCSHAVISYYKKGIASKEIRETNYTLEGLPVTTYDSFKIGIKIKID